MAGLLDEVWTPDERTRALRRLTNRRERLVRARTRAKNEAHGVLSRNLLRAAAGYRRVRERPAAHGSRSCSCPIDERLTLDGCLRQVDFLDGEVAALDREVAQSGARSGPRSSG